MCHAFFNKVLVPVSNEFIREIIGFINKQNKFFVFATFFDVGLKILRVEKVWVSGVHNLKQNIRPFDNTPELLPNFNVLLERSNGQFDIIFFNSCKVSSPFKKRYVFLLVDLLSRHLFIPSWSSWNFHWLVLWIFDALIIQEFVEHSVVKTVLKIGSRNDCVTTDDLLLPSISFSSKLLL